MAERLKILLVDNDSGNINWLLSFKDQIPADYTLANSIKEVKEIQTQEVFDVILLNLSLPDCSGCTCLEKIKELKPDIPVVVLVTPEQASEALDSSKNGAQGFIILGSLEGEFITSVIYQAYQRQKIVNEIRESQRQYSSLISNLPGFVYRCQNDANWTMDFVSEGFGKLTGYAPEDVVFNKKISYSQIIHPDYRTRINAEIQEAIKQKDHFELTYRIITADQKEKWVWEQGSAVDSSTSPIILEGFVTDITEKKIHEFQMQSIINIGEILRTAYQSDNTSREILDEISKLYKTDCAAFLLTTKKENIYSMESATGTWESVIGNIADITDCVSSSAVLENRIIQVDSQLEPGKLCPAFERKASKFMVFIPLNLQKRKIGLMIFGREFKFTSQELDVFRTIADMILSGIERNNLNTNIEKQLKHLESLHAIDQAITSVFDINVVNKIILDQACKELEADAADILILNQPANLLEYAGTNGFIDHSVRNMKIPLTTSVAGKVLLENQEFGIPDLEETPLWFIRKNMQIENFKAYFARPLSLKGETVGVMEVFFHHKFYPDKEWDNFFEALSTQAAVAYDSYRKYSDLQKMQQNTISSFRSTIETWSKSLELQDIESHGHIHRVTNQTIRLAREMGVAEKDLPDIERGALLHDIGKIGIMDDILQKKGKLTQEEWIEIKRHPQIARDLLSNVKMLEDALDIPFSHHENWDGSGYPQGLKGEEIPLAARIFTVVETYDALTSLRPYRKAWSKEEAVQYLLEQKGKKFDPEIVDAFLKSVG